MRKRERFHWTKVQLSCGCELSFGRNVIAKLNLLPVDDRTIKCPVHREWCKYEEVPHGQ